MTEIDSHQHCPPKVYFDAAGLDRLASTVAGRSAPIWLAGLALKTMAANERLEAVVARQAALLLEVNHRVANSLQLVSSLLHMHANAVGDEGSKAAIRDTQARIGAIMQVHRRLYASEDVERVDMSEYLAGLVDELGQSLSAGGCRPVLVKADCLMLPTDKAVAIGVIVAELVTNACKYAYGEDQCGDVRISLIANTDGVELIVEDDGVGVSGLWGEANSKGTGVGQTIVAAMCKVLGSSIAYDPAHRGARAVMTLSL